LTTEPKFRAPAPPSKIFGPGSTALASGVVAFESTMQAVVILFA